MNYLKYLSIRLRQEIEILYLKAKNKYLDWKIHRVHDKILRRITSDEEEKELLDMMSKEQKAYLVDYKVIPEAEEKGVIDES